MSSKDETHLAIDKGKRKVMEDERKQDLQKTKEEIEKDDNK